MTYEKTAILIHQTHRSLDIKKWISLGKWLESHQLKSILHCDRNWLFTAGIGYKGKNLLIDMFDTLVMISGRTEFSIDQIEKLLQDDHPFVSGWFYNKSPQGNRFGGRYREDTIEFSNDDNVQDLDFLSMDFCKIDCDSVLKKMSYPYFTNKIITIKGKDRNYLEKMREDWSFCLDSPIKPKVLKNLQVEISDV